MGRMTIRQMTEGIQNVLEGIPLFKQVQANATLSEAIPEQPLAQVYFEHREFQSSRTASNTFGGRRGESTEQVRVKKTTILVDVYARQRSNIATDIQAIQDLAELVDEALESQAHKPYFGLEQVEAFTYSSDRVTFDYNNVSYSGIRFTLDLTTM